MSEKENSQRLTLGQAIKDLGWFWWLFTCIVGGPSILSIHQTIFVDFQLTDLLQWIVDGYENLVTRLHTIILPMVEPIFDWVETVLGWELTLYPHWVPLFALISIPALSIIRATDFKNDFKGFFGGLIFLVGGLTGSVIGGTVPTDGTDDAQLYGAAATIFMPLCLVFALSLLGAGGKVEYRVFPAFLGAVVGTTALVVLFARLLNRFGLSRGFGLAGLGIAIILFGIIGLLTQFSKPRYPARAKEPDPRQVKISLTMLGGPITGGMILLVDWMLKLMN